MVDRVTKAANVRRALGDAALELFTEHGFDAVTVDDVAARAGVSRRTAFRHAPTKADLALGHHAVWVATLRAALEHDPDRPALARLRDAAAAVSAVAAADAERVLTAMRVSMAFPAVRARVAELDDDWLALVADVLAADPTIDDDGVEMLAGAVMGMISAALVGWARDDGERDLATLVDRGFDLLAPALS